MFGEVLSTCTPPSLPMESVCLDQSRGFCGCVQMNIERRPTESVWIRLFLFLQEAKVFQSQRPPAPADVGMKAEERLWPLALCGYGM